MPYPAGRSTMHFTDPMRYMPSPLPFQAGNVATDALYRAEEQRWRGDAAGRLQQRHDVEMDEYGRALTNEQQLRSGLEGVFAMPADQQAPAAARLEAQYGDPSRATQYLTGNYEEETQREYEILKLADTNPELAAAMAERYGVNIPPQVLNDARTRGVFSLAYEMGYERPEQAKVFIDTMLKTNDQQAAYNAAGHPQPAPPQAPAYAPSYDLIQGVGPDGQPVWGSFNSRTGDIAPVDPGFTPAPDSTGSGGGGGRMSVFEMKRAAYLEVYPGDDRGALEYASGRRQLSDEELWKFSITQATAQFRNQYGTPTQEQLNSKAQEIFDTFKALERQTDSPLNSVVPGAGAGGGYQQPQPYSGSLDVGPTMGTFGMSDEQLLQHYSQ